MGGFRSWAVKKEAEGQAPGPCHQATLQDPAGTLGSLAIVRCSQKLGFA